MEATKEMYDKAIRSMKNAAEDKFAEALSLESNANQCRDLVSALMLRAEELKEKRDLLFPPKEQP